MICEVTREIETGFECLCKTADLEHPHHVTHHVTHLWNHGHVRVMSGWCQGDVMVCLAQVNLGGSTAEEPLQAASVCALAPVLTWLRVEPSQVSLGITWIAASIYSLGGWPSLSQRFYGAAKSNILNIVQEPFGRISSTYKPYQKHSKTFKNHIDPHCESLMHTCPAHVRKRWADGSSKMPGRSESAPLAGQLGRPSSTEFFHQDWCLKLVDDFSMTSSIYSWKMSDMGARPC